ncbi:MAG: HAD family hydrolase, partial [Clostridia bacterium]|nr:HAD family hydrolase [Clostridia bacterium]
MAYKYLLFDLDGTLTDSEEGITKSVQYALNSFGIEETDRNTLRKFIGPSLDYSFKTFYGFDKEKARAATLKYRERFETIGLFENKLYVGIAEMLEKLKKEGKIIVLATSKPQQYAQKITEYFDIAKYFDEVSGAVFEGSAIEKQDI